MEKPPGLESAFESTRLRVHCASCPRASLTSHFQPTSPFAISFGFLPPQAFHPLFLSDDKMSLTIRLRPKEGNSRVQVTAQTGGEELAEQVSSIVPPIGRCRLWRGHLASSGSELTPSVSIRSLTRYLTMLTLRV
jgi:hypothetical protein